MDFETATASIAPRASNRPVQFPSLTFALRARTRCPANESPATLSVSIADSQLTIIPDATEEGLIEETIQVSHKQLGPVVVDDFCLDGEPDSAQVLELKGALSAHLSLRCSGENRESISYATSSLDVSIQCERPEPVATEQPEVSEE